jgi:membrane-bound lytic murein transglycosylase D
MPEDLIYLAMAESGLNPQAHSAAAALGIWQLIPSTARQYGLRVDEPGSAPAGELVDERRDPAKATDAAIAYLTYLYGRFGSWYLAAAAYNAGQGRLARIMTEVTGAEKGTDADYYRIWDSLPGETRDYIPATIALMRLGKDPARYGFATR